MNEPIPLPNARTRQMRWWYEMLADYMIAHPEARQGDIAAHFGRTQTTISLIINSDAFKSYFRQRRTEYTEQLDNEVRGKLYKVATSSLDNLLVSLEKKKDAVPIELLHRTTDMALRNLGYGVDKNATQGANVATVVNVAVSVADLEAAREALRRNQTAQSSPPLIDAGESTLDDPPAFAGSGETSLPDDKGE